MTSFLTCYSLKNDRNEGIFHLINYTTVSSCVVCNTTGDKFKSYIGKGKQSGRQKKKELGNCISGGRCFHPY